MKQFESSFASLYDFKCPAWLADAKLGIWSHWGPQSVPMCDDWYARNMYIQGSAQNLHHVRTYGHPSVFGYKDICALWKAENFDPDELMKLYVDAGAGYFVAQAMHHDNFFNYESKVNRMNSVKVGPHKDICQMWKDAASKYGLPFGLTEHLGASFSWWNSNKGADSYGPYAGVPYDGNDPEYRDFYHDNYEHTHVEADIWYTANKKFHQYWIDTMMELIDKFQPDLLYSDGGLPFAQYTGWGEGQELQTETNVYDAGLSVVAHLYNTSIAKYGENRAVYCQKDRRPEIYNVGVLDIERSQLPGIAESVWQTDTCIGHWFYSTLQTYKRPDQIIEMLVDIAAKNGVMLLNIPQKPDGTIDDEARFILTEMAAWRKVCGEGLFGTRPYTHYGEGETKVEIGGFTENKTNFDAADFRFTTKDNAIYAFLMGKPENGVSVIKTVEEEIKAVELLGYGPVEFTQNDGIITVKVPKELPTKYTNCLKLVL